MNIGFSIKTFIIGLIMVVIFYLSYSFLAQLEVPLWMLQYTFYAFMTAIFGFIFLGILAPLIRGRLEEAKKKKIEEKKALESLKKEYTACASYIKNNIEKFVEKNENADLGVITYLSNVAREVKLSEELKGQIQEFIEKYGLYNILHRASECVIKSFIEAEVRKKFPKTLEREFKLDEFLQVDYLMARYFNGEKVTNGWFKETYPREYNDIIKRLDESERDKLYIFFHELNDNFEKDAILQRFRKEKEELIKYSKETITKLQNEINTLNKQLKKYSSLRTMNEDLVINFTRPIP